MRFKNKKEAVEYLVSSLNCVSSGLILDSWKYASQIEKTFSGDRLFESVWEIVNGDNEGYIDFPMWGWVWGTTYSDWITDEWIEEHIEELEDIGFTIIHHDEYGYFLGIDGAGYDFYEAHWIPLYDLLGFKWVKE